MDTKKFPNENYPEDEAKKTCLALRGIELNYQEHIALNVPELDIYAGEILGLTGANGSGKSTLLRILALLQMPSKGIMSYEGKELSQIQHSQLRREITLLPQNVFLLDRSVAENIAYGIKLRHPFNKKPKKSNLQEIIEDSLKQVGMGADYMQRSWRALSGGEAQRVAIAARLALNPKILLLDEPTASLDEENSDIIAKNLREISKARGITIIIASHDNEWLKDLAERSVRLRHGKILE